MIQNVYLHARVKWILLSVCLLVPMLSEAQQDAQFTQYMYNGLFFNPAFAGKESGHAITALHRSQWLSYSTATGGGGAPTTQLITVSSSFDKANLGVGLTVVNDNIGAINNQEVNVALAYHLRMGRGRLSVGASGGFFSSTIDYGNLEGVNPDPLVGSGGRENQINNSVSLGLMYDRTNFYAGASVRHFNEPSFDFGEGFENRLENHHYVLVGYRINTFALFSVEPSILLKSISLNNFSYDVSVIGTYNKKLSVGLAYRGEESASILMGYSLMKDNSLRLGYAFDLVVGGLEAKSPTTHEFMLTYNLPQAKKELERVIQRTPRFRF
ncbi:MAG: type IX secretion system membrane protein PorP/SprF [Lunatimonas sp.]|uniref:PorP/SprF family type IX secretion system membrane protein n=1 Tax=Lunatimonas sp. TaxID=2060141 RepID=UPI00263A4136|nr:type IX secretion system membrane protein PorP/SprF [Lunatimonas sp.]MCC5937743.1 type IX secretion system membrane protein PorP/SprF [Lunatimonas sp.]